MASENKLTVIAPSCRPVYALSVLLTRFGSASKRRQGGFRADSDQKSVGMTRGLALLVYARLADTCPERSRRTLLVSIQTLAAEGSVQILT